MAILIDTQALVWIGIGSPRLSEAARTALTDGVVDLFVSAVTAYEFVDLNNRGRFGSDLPFGDLIDRLEASVLDFPASAWRIAEDLPDLHRDPVDRMLVAHAIASDLTVLTADATLRAYGVRSLW